MKILIACDERSSADKIYYDLKRAGLPELVQACIFSVADVFVLPGYKPVKSKRPSDKKSFKHIDEEIKKAQVIADHMRKKLKLKFPKWSFHAESCGGSPAWKILEKAKDWKADLIVIGAHGRMGLGGYFFGSVALRVMSEATCSVRIVRPHTQETNSPSRIVIGVDGSRESDAAINILRERRWMKGSSAHLVTAVGTMVYSTSISDMYPDVYIVNLPDESSIKKKWQINDNKNPRAWITKMHDEYKSTLEKSGLVVSSFIEDGDTKVILLQETERYGADSIFVGATGHGMINRYLIGSVSSAIAGRAHCSVEIIRTKPKNVRPRRRSR
ncbi:MAG: universal stress protein [Candidatus Omnitrophica bacterium]|nr:universal stress protein [Candidatus Omnitrophota bacterium]